MRAVETVAILSGNGGSARSTTAGNLGYWLTENWEPQGLCRYLVASLDEQDDSSYLLGVPSSNAMMRYITQPMVELSELVQPSPIDCVGVLASNRQISLAEQMVAQLVSNAEDKMQMRQAYADKLREMATQFRVVIFDTPNQGELRIVSLMAADRCILTTKLAAHNIKNTLAVFKLADQLLPAMADICILPVMLETSQKTANEEALAYLWSEVSKINPARNLMMGAGVPRSVAVTDAANALQPVLQYAPYNATTVRGKRAAAASIAYHAFFHQVMGV